MRYFFKKLSLFSLIFVLIGSTLSLAYYYSMKAALADLLSDYKFKPIIIIGDSNTECALDDALLQNCTNISFSAEAYFYSYVKLREVLKYNPQVKIVILGYSFYSLLQECNSWVISKPYAEIKFISYFPFLNFNDIFSLFLKNISLVSKIHEAVRKSPGTLHNTRFLLGGHKALKKTIAPKNRIAKKTVFHPSPVQYEYLRKISDLCKKKSIRLILLNTPKHRSVIEALDSTTLNEYKSFYEYNLAGNLFVDHSHLDLADSCFADDVHLNEQGAKLYSTMVNQMLQRWTDKSLLR